MSYRHYPDGNGDTIRLYDDDGRMLLGPVPAMKQLTSREDDVLLCSYPKSGTHWIWEIILMLKTGKPQITTVPMKSHHLMLSEPADLDQLDSPRVLVIHRRFHDLPSDFIINKRKMVLMLRDPKDVCVSFYHFLHQIEAMEYTGKFDGFTTLFLQGKVPFNMWTSWVKSFEKGLKEHPELPYHAVHYDQLLQDPVKEIRRLAEYLEVDPALADAVAQQTQFSVMKNAKIHNDAGGPVEIFKDKRVNIHVYRKGESGGWKEWFNEEQQAQFDDHICKQLGRSSIQPLL